MKTHTRNLIFASLVYIAVFIGIVVISMVSDSGVSFFLDEELVNPDTIIFIESVFFTCLASFAAYLVFYLIQRHQAKNDPNARFLGIVPCVIGAGIAGAISCGVVFLCLRWTSDYGDEISLLNANPSLVVGIIGVVAAANFVNFIVFKPRV